jgi:osmotically-inducible protein OsmY
MRRDSNPLVSFLAGAAIGAGLMFLLDPDRGTRRRALARDQVLSAGRRAGDQLGVKARHLGNRARGLAASARTRFKGDEAEDEVVEERVRAELGRVVAHPSPVIVEVEHGVVTLSGPILTAEREELISAVRAVRGVRDVEDRLEIHESTTGAPGRHP